MWESRRRLARFPRGSWKGWEACSWLSTLSTAPAFPQLRLFLLRLCGYFWSTRRVPAVVGYCGPESFFFLLFFSR
jgi:hypothetical protein